MSLEYIKQVERLRVLKNDREAGIISRTPQGCEFRYTPEYLAQASPEPVAFSLPCREDPWVTTGDNLPPFFAGLLPEGRRLEALIGAIKTSPDDMFSLLAAAGKDTIGDVHVELEGADGEPSRDNIPDLPTPEDLSAVSFHELFERSIGQGNMAWRDRDSAIAGVIPKLSSQLISFPVSLAKSNKRYILKLQPQKYPCLVKNEMFFMSLAETCGLETPKCSVVRDKDGVTGLLVERFDRVFDRSQKRFCKIHLEDACQLLARYPQDKYRLSMRDVAERIAAVASSPEIEVARLVEVYVFSYLIGNGDLHAKNISVLVQPHPRRVRLSPAYDLVSTLPYGDQSMALSLEGRDKKIRAKDVRAFSTRAGISTKATDNSIHRMVARVSLAIPALEDIGMDQKKTRFLANTIRERLAMLAA